MTELVGNGKFIVVLVVLLIEAEGYERKTFTITLGHNDETELLKVGGKVVSGLGEVVHDAAVAMLAKTNKLVVLANDLGGTLGKVKSEGSLIGAEVVDVEDELLWEELWLTPDNPSYSWVDETCLSQYGAGRFEL